MAEDINGRKERDFAIGLLAYEPAGKSIGWLPQPLSIQAAMPFSGLPTLIFTYPKDAPMGDLLLKYPAGFEVALMVYVPQMLRWYEPPNCRFVVLQWEDDVTQDNNVMKFTCPGIAWLFSKQLVFKGKKDDALNKVEADAIRAAETAENDLRSKESALNSNLSLVKSSMKSKGNTYALDYFPAKVKVGKSWQKPKNKSILYHGGRRQFYWYTGKWYRITKKEVTDRINDTDTKYQRVVQARNSNKTVLRRKDNAVANAKEATKSGRRPMYKTTAGWAIRRHWDEAVARGHGRLRGIGRTFNGTYATSPGASRKWKNRFDFELTIGMSLLDIIENLTEMGQIEWQMRGRTLDVAIPGTLGKDVSKWVGLHLGKDLLEAPDKATRHDFADYLLVRGEDNLSFGMRNPKSDPAVGWGTWEKNLSASGAKRVTDAKQIVDAEAKLSQRRVKIESTRQIRLHPEAPHPMYDYLPGQTIRIYGVDGTMQKSLVQQITLIQDDEGLLTGALILGDRFRAGPLNFRKSLSTTLGGYEKTIGGGTVPLLPPPKPGPPPIKRLPPMTLAGGARVAINEATGESSVIMSLDWSPADGFDFEPLLPSEEPSDSLTDPDGYLPDY